jgi:hypothetical protein
MPEFRAGYLHPERIIFLQPGGITERLIFTSQNQNVALLILSKRVIEGYYAGTNLIAAGVLKAPNCQSLIPPAISTVKWFRINKKGSGNSKQVLTSACCLGCAASGACHVLAAA